MNQETLPAPSLKDRLIDTKTLAELTQSLLDSETLPADISLKDHLEAKQTISCQLDEDFYVKLECDSEWNHWIFRVYQEERVFYKRDYWHNGNPEERSYYLNGQLHREDGPAFECFYKNDKLRERGYYLNGQAHCQDGPAIEYFDANGNLTLSYYYLNGQLHREDGPAFESLWSNGNPEERGYYLNGQLHREDGPAVEVFDEDGDLRIQDYYLNGQRLSEEEWSKQVNASSLN